MERNFTVGLYRLQFEKTAICIWFAIWKFLAALCSSLQSWQFEYFLAKTRLCFLNTTIILITFSSRRSWCSGLSYYYSKCQLLFYDAATLCWWESYVALFYCMFAAIILLGLINHNKQSDLQNTIKNIFKTKKTNEVNYA